MLSLSGKWNMLNKKDSVQVARSLLARLAAKNGGQDEAYTPLMLTDISSIEGKADATASSELNLFPSTVADLWR